MPGLHRRSQVLQKAPDPFISQTRDGALGGERHLRIAILHQRLDERQRRPIARQTEDIDHLAAQAGIRILQLPREGAGVPRRDLDQILAHPIARGCRSASVSGSSGAWLNTIAANAPASSTLSLRSPESAA